MQKALFFTSLLFLSACSSSTPVSQKTIIAHRGASGYLPEHTLEAASMAHAFNADFIEPDIVLTKDGVPIVLHDIVLDEVTDVEKRFPKRKREDGHFYAIDFTLEEIKSLKVSSRVDPKNKRAKYSHRFPPFSSNFQIPTLKELIELVQGLNKSRKKRIGLYPEIKRPLFHQKAGHDITDKVLTLLKNKGYFKKENKDLLFLQCFVPQTLKRVKKEFDPPFRLIQLIADPSWVPKGTPIPYGQMRTPQGLASISNYADGTGVWLNHLAGNEGVTFVRNAHKEDLLVHAYTVRKDRLPPGVSNLKELLHRLFVELTVDGVFTDHPDKVLQFFERGEN